MLKKKLFLMGMIVMALASGLALADDSATPTPALPKTNGIWRRLQFQTKRVQRAEAKGLITADTAKPLLAEIKAIQEKYGIQKGDDGSLSSDQRKAIAVELDAEGAKIKQAIGDH
jgi:hypothetical protein